MAEAEEEIHDAVGAEREADELPSALVRPPLGQILRNSLDRPWLGLYRVPSATSNGGASADEEDRGFGLAPGEEVWVKICTSLPFLDLGRLGMVCTTLQRATANPALWEARCLKAWRLPGFVPCTDVLLEYGWSWRRMVRALEPRARAPSPPPCAFSRRRARCARPGAAAARGAVPDAAAAAHGRRVPRGGDHVHARHARGPRDEGGRP